MRAIKYIRATTCLILLLAGFQNCGPTFRAQQGSEELFYTTSSIAGDENNPAPPTQTSQQQLEPFWTFFAKSMNYTFDDFSSDPNWIGSENLHNRVCKRIEQNFGYQSSQNAIGGRIYRSSSPAMYGLPTPPLGWNNRMAFSGRIKLVHSDGNGEVFIGYYNHDSRTYRPNNFIGFRVANGRVELSATNNLFQSEGEFIGPGIPKDELYHRFSFEYDRGRLTFRIDSEERHFQLNPSGIMNGNITIDRVGMLNVMLPGAAAIELYLDDLSFNHNNAYYPFDSNPNWDSYGSFAKFDDCVQRPNQNYGYSTTNYNGLGNGEIGGLIWRWDINFRPSYFAAGVSVTLQDPLFIKGNLYFKYNPADSDILFGYFDEKGAYSHLEVSSFIGIHIGGPTRIGHRFEALAYSQDGKRHTPEASNTPVIHSNGKSWPFEWRYDPRTRLVDWILDDQSFRYQIPEELNQELTRYNLFGILPMRPDGQAVEIYFDNLTWTTGRK